MKTGFRITLVIAAVFIGAIFAAWAYLFWTPPGCASLKQLIEARIASALGGSASISDLDGALPGEVILEDVRLADNGEDWLIVDRAELRWRPSALLSKTIAVDLAHVEGARLLKTPPKKPDDREKPRGFELPDRLPRLTVGDLKITNFRVAPSLAGEEVRLDGAGSVRMGGRVLSINLAATSSGDRDYFDARIERTGDALAATIVLKSDASGAIASIARLGGPIFVEAKGDGPLADYKLQFKSSLGAYGVLNGTVSGDLERMETIGFSADAELGEKLSNTSKIVGSKAAFAGEFSPLADGGELRVAHFRSALGAAEGTARWRNRNKAIDTLAIKASADLDENWRPDIRPYIGDEISVDGELRPKGGAYVAGGDVRATHFDGALNSVATDLRAFVRGPAIITLKANDALPGILADGADASGDFELLPGDSIRATPISLKTAHGGTFKGEARYNFDTRAFAVKGDVSAPPEMISALNAKLSAKRNASGGVDIKGTPDKFAGTAVAVLPPLLVDGKAFPATRLSLAFADAPAAPSGQISLRAVDDSLRLQSNFARSANGAMRASGIDYIGADFALKGNAAVLPDGGGVDVDLAYRGVDAAEPWPGVRLAGDFTVKGSVARGAVSNSLTVKAGALSSRSWSVEGLSATAEGPSSRLAVKASAASLAVKGATPTRDVTADVIAVFQKMLSLTLTKLSADLAGAPVTLSEPARIEFIDGVSVEKFRAAIGRNGSFAIDGGVSKKRWRARIAARQAPIVSAASVIDLDLDLDTDRPTPANGAFTMSSLLTKTENASFSGDIVWDGRSIAISSAGGNEALDLSLSLPARLTRAPSLRVSTEGALSGEARYAGRIETIAGFLPAALQSIEGAMTFDGRASGTLAEPKLAGDLAVSGGAFTELSTGLSIVNIDATARAESALSGSRIDFSATGTGVRQKEKTISAGGTITLGKEQRLASRMTLNAAKLSAGPITEVEATGDIDLSGPFSDLLAKGDITVRSLDARVFTPETTGLVDINVVRVNGDGESVFSAKTSPAPTAISYAIGVSGNDRIFIRGRGLESEWRANVRIAGRADAPVILGSMTMKDGEITFAGRRFDMTKGDISFDRLSINNPSLDLRAERETKSGTLAVIVIEGRGRAPKISLTSTPALPQEDIMALILFDKPASELSAIESLQVAEGLAELGGIGPFGGNGITGSARQALGLDLLNVNVDQADGAASSLTVGKYVADGLFVSATQDARGENGSVRIEYEIDQSFTVETELRQDGDQKASINWKHDF